jgi:Sulfotransferase domain
MTDQKNTLVRIAKKFRKYVPGQLFAKNDTESQPTNDAMLRELTIFHVTHWKAGSQWIYKILRQCAPDRIVAPRVGGGQFSTQPLEAGKVYPTIYVTRQQFESAQLPEHWRRFVVIRDLRDTLISAYFSFKVSHPVLDASMEMLRTKLTSSDFDDGLIFLMDNWLPLCVRIQTSWLDAGERVLRYEDLLEHDVELLEQVLLDECQLPIERERFRTIVLANRFERIAKGRQRGQEDLTAHERKGIAGDWRNHFDDRVKAAFKERFSDLLVATGYERDSNW